MLEFTITILILAPLVVLVSYVVRTHILASRIRVLERTVRELQDAVWTRGEVPRAPRTESIPAAGAAPAGVPAQQPAPAPEAVSEGSAQPAAAAVGVRRPGAPRRTRGRGEWEQLVGGRLLNRIGAIALILGVGFFYKYAVDRAWIPEGWRVAIGIAAGSFLLAAAFRWDRRGFAVFAQGLFGAGVAILYLSGYASFSFYHLVPQSLAFVYMSAVTALALALALRKNSIAVSLLGWAGGFLTPILLRAGHIDAAGLFMYVALLDAGLIAVLHRRPAWMLLEPLTLLATYATYFAWFVEAYAKADFVPGIAAAAVFWGLFFALELARAGTADLPYRREREGIAVTNAALFAAALAAVLDASHPAWRSAGLLAAALAYAAAFVALRAGGEARRPTAARVLVVSIVLLAMSIASEYRFFVVIAIWSAVAAAVFVAGVRTGRRHAWASGALLLALAIFLLLTRQESFAASERVVPMWNARALAFAACAAAAAIVAAFGAGAHRRIPDAGWSAAAFLVAVGFAVELFDFAVLRRIGASETYGAYLTAESGMLLAVGWTVLSVAYAWTGAVRRIPALRYAGWTAAGAAVLVLVVAGWRFGPPALYVPVANVRALGAALLVVALALHARIPAPADERRIAARIRRIGFPVAATAVGFVLLTGETSDFFSAQISAATGSDRGAADTIERLENLRQLSISSVWLVYSIALMAAGILRRTRLARVLSFALFGIGILKIFLYDLSSLQTLYRIFSFVGLGLILLLVSWLYQRYRDVLFGEAAAPDAAPSGDGGAGT